MYTVKFLDSESFDNLPYKDITQSVGVADRNKGVAYVRDTGDPLIIFNAYHELEHLKGDDLGEHESPGEDGVYYKKFSDVVSSVAAPLGSLFGPIGGVVGSLFGGMGSKQQQPQQQQPAMQPFTPSMPTQAQAAAPATSAIGGQGAGMEGGSGGQSGASRIRNDQELAQAGLRSKGFYGGR